MRKIKPKSSDEMYGPIRTHGKEKVYPHVRIDIEHLPEAKDWKLGESHEIHFKGKLTHLSQSKFQNEAEFDVTHIEPSDKNDKEEDGDDSAADDDKEEKVDEGGEED